MLYYGNNLGILRDKVPSESVDLVYLDPPFNSNASYNVLFAEQDGTRAAAQIRAFEDTWRWDEAAALAYHQVVEAGGDVSTAMQAFRMLLGDSDMLAYLAMMAPRLVQLRRVLKPTGSIYLHCDPTASHYLKLLMDAVFGPHHFSNELIWRRHNARRTEQRWPRVHDVLLFYTKSSRFYYQSLQIAADAAKLPHTLITGPDGEKYQTYELTAPGVTKVGLSGKPWRDFDPTKMGRHWAHSPDTMDAWADAGLIHWPRPGKAGGFPRRRAAEPFVAEARKITVGDVWTDIDRINQAAKERLGYPTQKPEELLDRIITASSEDDSVILDPFCGCGTAIAVAQGLGRRWIGIDITHLAIGLIKHRLQDAFGLEPNVDYQVRGEPEDLASAKQLAQDAPFQFQAWALGLVTARATEPKKGADKGIDGRAYFHDEFPAGKTKQIIFSVKGGHLQPAFVRELRGVVTREGAEMGVLLTLEPPTIAMRSEASTAGFYYAPAWGQDYPKLQILTVGDLLNGKRLNAPPLGQVGVTFKKAPHAEPEPVGTLPLPLGPIAVKDPGVRPIRTRRRSSTKPASDSPTVAG
jgi:DNA modification methylase